MRSLRRVLVVSGRPVVDFVKAFGCCMWFIRERYVAMEVAAIAILRCVAFGCLYQSSKLPTQCVLNVASIASLYIAFRQNDT
jgi:hypothetical protein